MKFLRTVVNFSNIWFFKFRFLFYKVVYQFVHQVWLVNSYLFSTLSMGKFWLIYASSLNSQHGPQIYQLWLKNSERVSFMVSFAKCEITWWVLREVILDFLYCIFFFFKVVYQFIHQVSLVKSEITSIFLICQLWLVCASSLTNQQWSIIYQDHRWL